MFSNQRVAFFEGIGRYGLDEGSASLGLGFVISKLKPSPVSALIELPVDQDVALNYFPSTMPAAKLPVMIMD